MIKAIVFDIGGVCVLGSMSEFYNKACKYLCVHPKYDFYQKPLLSEKYNKGLISARDCFNQLFERDMTDDEYEHLRNMWLNTFVRNEPIYEYIKQLKQAGYRLAVLSNSDQVVSDKLAAEGLYDDFELTILSHEHGVVKPGPEIYKVLINYLGLEPEEILFIDDVVVNLDTAVKLGMNVILFKEVEQFKKELNEILHLSK